MKKDIKFMSFFWYTEKKTKERKRVMNWMDISQEKDLSISFMKEHEHLINWIIFCGLNKHITTQKILELCEYIHWNSLSTNPVLTIETVMKFEKQLNWNILCLYNFPLYEKVKETADQYINWFSLPTDAKEHKMLDDTFFIRFQDKLDWEDFFQKNYYPINSTILHAVHESINWERISYLRLHQQKLEVCQEFLNWDTIALNDWIPEHTLSVFIERIRIPFLLKHRQVKIDMLQWLQAFDRLDWKVTAKHQKLPYSFIKKHIEHIDLKVLFQNQHIHLTETEKNELLRLKKKPFFKKIKSLFSSHA